MCSEKTTESQEGPSSHQHPYFMSQAWPIPSPTLMEKNFTFHFPQISNPSSPSSTSVDEHASHFIKKSNQKRSVTSSHHAYSSPASVPTGAPSLPVRWTHHRPYKANLALVSQTSSPLTLLLRCPIPSLGYQFFALYQNIPTSIIHALTLPPNTEQPA